MRSRSGSWTNGWERNLCSCLLLHISFILHFLSQRKVACLKVSSLHYGISDSPGVDLPSVVSFVTVCLEEIIVRLEIWHHVDFTFVKGPAQVKDDQRKELHHVKGRRHCVTSVLHEHWLHSLFGKECSFFKLHNT